MKGSILLLGAILMTGIMSCASTPTEPVSEVTIEELDTAQKSVESAREKADSIKASVSAPDEYQNGETKLKEALELREKNEFSLALESYIESRENFNTSYTIAEEKKKAAEAAIAKANEAIESAQKKAAQAQEETDEGDEE